MKKNYSIDKTVMSISIVIFGLIFILSIINKNTFVYLNGLVTNIFNSTGWFINIASALTLVICAYFYFGEKGNIKLGGKDAKPEFSKFTWWALSLCAGMGMGIVFFPPAEIIEYAFNPPVGTYVEPGSFRAIAQAFELTYMHWSVILYGVYVSAGVIAGHLYYNLNKPFSTVTYLYPVFGEKIYKYRSLIDGIVVFAVIGGVAGSFGYGLLQVGDGIGQMFNITSGPTLWIILAIVITIIYTLSSVTGLKSGIQWLGDNNAKIFIGLLIFTFIFGPIVLSLNLGVETAGSFFGNFFTNLFLTESLQGGEKWSIWWNWLWYVDYFIFAPTTGLFLAKLAKGRTIKEFISVNFVAPCVFAFIWIMIFGGLAIDIQLNRGIDLYQVIQNSGHEAVMLTMFNELPLPQLTKPIMLITVLVSFITLANATTFTISSMSFKPNEKYDSESAPASIQIFWGTFMAVIAVVFLLNGGLDGAKTVKLLVGLPMVIFMFISGIGFLKMTDKKHSKKYIVNDDIDDDTLEKSSEKIR